MPRGAPNKAKTNDEIKELLSAGLLSQEPRNDYCTRTRPIECSMDESGNQTSCALVSLVVKSQLIQEVLPIQRVALGWTEACVADNPAQLFLGRAVRHPGCSHHVFLQHD